MHHACRVNLRYNHRWQQQDQERQTYRQHIQHDDPVPCKGNRYRIYVIRSGLQGYDMTEILQGRQSQTDDIAPKYPFANQQRGLNEEDTTHEAVVCP